MRPVLNRLAAAGILAVAALCDHPDCALSAETAPTVEQQYIPPGYQGASPVAPPDGPMAMSAGCSTCGGGGLFGGSSWGWGGGTPCPWRTRCNMPIHLTYRAEWDYYYYFRPYNALHIPKITQLAAGWGWDPQNPYDDRRLFNDAFYHGLLEPVGEVVPVPAPEWMAVPQQGEYVPSPQGVEELPPPRDYNNAPATPGYNQAPGYNQPPTVPGYEELPAPQRYNPAPAPQGYNRIPDQPRYGNPPSPQRSNDLPAPQGYDQSRGRPSRPPGRWTRIPPDRSAGAPRSPSGRVLQATSAATSSQLSRNPVPRASANRQGPASPAKSAMRLPQP